MPLEPSDFNPADFNDIADAMGVFQRQEMLRQLAQLRAKEQASEEHQRKLPQCPACGGRLEGQFQKCMRCATDLAWVEGVPCEPGQAVKLRQSLQERRRAESARSEWKQARHKADLSARGVTCPRCCELSLPEDVENGRCWRCNRKLGRLLTDIQSAIVCFLIAAGFGWGFWAAFAYDLGAVLANLCILGFVSFFAFGILFTTQVPQSFRSFSATKRARDR